MTTDFVAEAQECGICHQPFFEHSRNDLITCLSHVVDEHDDTVPQPVGVAAIRDGVITSEAIRRGSR